MLRSLPSAIDAPDTLDEPNAVFSQFLGSASMTFFFLFSSPCFLLSCLFLLFLSFLAFLDFSFLSFPYSFFRSLVFPFRSFIFF